MSNKGILGRIKFVSLTLPLLFMIASCGGNVDSQTGDTSKTTSQSAPASPEASQAASSSGMSGTWGSYFWMDDNVGEFLKITSTGKDSYLGIFYSQGQNGGIFEDLKVIIKDRGDGLAEVTWPSGTKNIATWGKRDSETPGNMDPSWNGDIWFDCLGEVDFAESRADCDFYFKK